MDVRQIALEMQYKSKQLDYYIASSRINVVSLYLSNEIWLPREIINKVKFEENDIIAVGIYNGSIAIKDAWGAMNDKCEVDYQFLTLHIIDDFTIYMPVQFRSMDYENKALIEVDTKKRQIVINDRIY